MEDGELKSEIQSRLGTAGRVWNNMSRVVYDKHMPLSLKAQMYRTMVCAATLYGAEAMWLVKRQFNSYQCSS